MVLNSQWAVFASSGFIGNWRRVQKSFLDFIGSGTIRRILDHDLFFAPCKKHLALPTAGIVSAAIRKKTSFVEWHTTRGG